ncbi:MAG: DUF2791 family P-loop domain-containing protein [Solobacterium sp.]|nr:DUF2791 family P-loop domain-containing protein [Solobacterium sp.]
MIQSSSGDGFLLEFLDDMYLKDFIAKGGSKIKFVTGRPGSGKTYFQNKLSEAAKQDGYVVVSLSAKQVWLNDFKEVYLAVLSKLNFDSLIQDCAKELIRKLDYDPDSIPEGQRFIDYLASHDEANILTKRALREELSRQFLQNPLLDNNFASICAQLTADILGHPTMEDGDKDILYRWLNADKTVKLTELRMLGLAPVRITKFNARHMLRSLAEMIRIGGNAGLIVLVDDLDILQDNSGLEELHYTKMKRDDTYESIRQLIDDIDTMRSLMFVFAFDRALMDNEREGLKSYQALWMRIQNEVYAERMNRFSDILDLDRLANQVYDSDYILEMSLRFAEEAERTSRNAMILDDEAIRQIIEKAKFGSTGLPELIRKATLEGESK